MPSAAVSFRDLNDLKLLKATNAILTHFAVSSRLAFTTRSFYTFEALHMKN